MNMNNTSKSGYQFKNMDGSKCKKCNIICYNNIFS